MIIDGQRQGKNWRAKHAEFNNKLNFGDFRL